MARDDRWQHLVQLAFRLSESVQDPESPAAREAVRALDSALEVFGPEIDPIEDFEGYALRRLLLALRTAIQSR